MNKETITVSVPFSEWEKIQSEINSVEALKNEISELTSKLNSERLDKAVMFMINADYDSKVSVRTVKFNEKIDTKNFESELQKAVQREMELRKEYEDKIQNLWRVFARTPLWVLKMFGLKETKKMNNQESYES
jgi:hypothetical protein